MKYDRKEAVLHLSAREMVERAASSYLHTPLDEAGGLCPILPEDKEPWVGERRFSVGEVACLVTVTACRDTEGVAVYFRTDEDPRHPSRRTKSLSRGLGFLAAYILGGGESMGVTVVLDSPLYGQSVRLCERPTAGALRAFWERICAALGRDLDHEVDRTVRRMPTMAELRFPYGRAREGQKDMMAAVFSAAKRGDTLFATAPTGTGKTMAALYPAVRAVGEGYIKKVFYLTPKTTSARVAEEAVCDMARAGALVRGIYIHAKERLCDRRREAGHCASCRRRRGGKTREAEATDALLALAEPVITEEMLLRTAAAFDVCPHELALSYSMYADVIIGDYNYLFDPRAYLRRFFEVGGEYFLLLDEAHNLPDRARAMYSGELSAERIAALEGLFSHSALLSEHIGRIKAAFYGTLDTMLHGELREDPNGTVVGFATDTAFPTRLCDALAHALDSLVPCFKPSQNESAEDRARREAVYELAGLYEKICRMDEHYITYALREGELRRLCFFCIDPAVPVCERLDRCKGAVFFSATLAPLSYYRSVLCGGRQTRTVEVASPFSEESLCVGIMDKISVRATAREETMPELARVVATVMKAREGNYMVFCPSFSYMERLAEAFHALAPRAPFVVQGRQMSARERAEFLSKFAPRKKGYFVGFCVTGGIYSEGIDLVGDRLIGAIVIGVGLPGVSAEREIIARYYQEKYDEGKEYAYLYPGMNRVLQAAGRVIRKETDRGVIVLIDDRLRDPACIKIFPDTWRHLKYAGDRRALTALLTRFWQRVDEETKSE